MPSKIVKVPFHSVGNGCHLLANNCVLRKISDDAAYDEVTHIMYYFAPEDAVQVESWCQKQQEWQITFYAPQFLSYIMKGGK